MSQGRRRPWKTVKVGSIGSLSLSGLPYSPGSHPCPYAPNPIVAVCVSGRTVVALDAAVAFPSNTDPVSYSLYIPFLK